MQRPAHSLGPCHVLRGPGRLPFDCCLMMDSWVYCPQPHFTIYIRPFIELASAEFGGHTKTCPMGRTNKREIRQVAAVVIEYVQPRLPWIVCAETNMWCTEAYIFCSLKRQLLDCARHDNPYILTSHTSHLDHDASHSPANRTVCRTLVFPVSVGKISLLFPALHTES